MKKIIFLYIFFCPVFLIAQEPVVWNNTTKEIGANTYEIHLKATIRPPWHLYSQRTPEDGPQKATIIFQKNPVATFSGPVKEEGTLIKKREEVFDIDVMYYNNEVDFVQIVKLKGNTKTNITGTVTYMVCNDKECQPPKKIMFRLDLQ